MWVVRKCSHDVWPRFFDRTKKFRLDEVAVHYSIWRCRWPCVITHGRKLSLLGYCWENAQRYRSTGISWFDAFLPFMYFRYPRPWVCIVYECVQTCLEPRSKPFLNHIYDLLLDYSYQNLRASLERAQLRLPSSGVKVVGVVTRILTSSQILSTGCVEVCTRLCDHRTWPG